MTQYELEQINARRRAQGLPPLSRAQADTALRERASSARSDDSGFDTTHFLIGYLTGIPMPSGAGIMGAMMHPSPAHSEPSQSSSSDSFSGGGGSYGGGGASSSWDSSSSSSSSDSSSSSSSSSDSGSSSSGGGGE